MKGIFLIASLLLAGLVYTLARKNDNFDEQNDVEVATGAWQNPETCIGSCSARGPEDGAVLLQNKDCTKYCICGGGRATVNVCPEGLHFSLEEQVCTWTSDANCEDDIFNDKPEATTESWRNPDTCKGYCPDKDPANKTILLENKDCTKYCSCSNGNPIVNVCPKGLHFSLKEQVCTWPSDANCEEDENKKVDKDDLQFYDSNSLNIFKEIHEATTESWRNPDTCKGYCPAKDPEDKTILLENKDCTKYCSCSNGKPIVNVCPKGLHFSLKEQVCTWPSDANCPQSRSYEPMYEWIHSPRDY